MHPAGSKTKTCKSEKSTPRLAHGPEKGNQVNPYFTEMNGGCGRFDVHLLSTVARKLLFHYPTATQLAQSHNSSILTLSHVSVLYAATSCFHLSVIQTVMVSRFANTVYNTVGRSLPKRRRSLAADAIATSRDKFQPFSYLRLPCSPLMESAFVWEALLSGEGCCCIRFIPVVLDPKKMPRQNKR